jgi:hypothetical protein
MENPVTDAFDPKNFLARAAIFGIVHGVSSDPE